MTVGCTIQPTADDRRLQATANKLAVHTYSGETTQKTAPAKVLEQTNLTIN